MDKLNVKVILGSTREGRLSDKPGTWIAEAINAREDMQAEILDLRDYPMPFFDQQETPGYKSKPYAEPTVVKWTAKIAEADAFVIIAPEYNHGYPAVLKNAMDWVYQEWNNKPVAFISYGSALGARSVEQLREVAVELQLAPIRNGIHMPYTIGQELAGGKSMEEVFAPYMDRAKGLLDQLAWWGTTLKGARK